VNLHSESCNKAEVDRKRIGCAGLSGGGYRATYLLGADSRTSGGDSFASGLTYGILMGRGPQWAVECGAAHGALAMSTSGDTTMATLAEVEWVMKRGSARVAR